MSLDLLSDYNSRVLLGLLVINLLILLWLGRAWLRGTKPKTSPLFAWMLLLVCAIMVLNTFLERYSAQ